MNLGGKKIILLAASIISCCCHDDACGPGRYRCGYMFNTSHWGRPLKIDHYNDATLLENGVLMTDSGYFDEIEIHDLSTVCNNNLLEDIIYYNQSIGGRNFIPHEFNINIPNEDHYILVISASTCYKLDPSYNLILLFGDSGSSDEILLHAICGEVDEFGNSYIVDIGDSSIKSYDINGNFINKWNNIGYSSFIKIMNRSVYLVDKSSDSIKKYDMSGNYVKTISLAFFDHIVSFGFEDANKIWVIDFDGRRVSQAEIKSNGALESKEVKIYYCYDDINYQFGKLVSISTDLMFFRVADYGANYVLHFRVLPD